MTTTRRTLALPPKPQSVTRARHWVADRLVDDGWLAEPIRDAELCVSELAANAVAHAATDFVVEIEDADGLLRITVSDLDDRTPRSGQPTADAPTGRGLRLVAATALRWGVVPRRPHGKSVWCELLASP